MIHRNDEPQCPQCGFPLAPDARVCRNCGTLLNLKDSGTALKTAGRFGLAVAIGLAISLICGMIWAAIVVVSNVESSWLAIAIGVATGFAVRKLTPERSLRTGMVAILLALAGLAVGKILTVEYQIRASVREEMQTRYFVKDDTLPALLANELVKAGELPDPDQKLNQLKAEGIDADWAMYQQAEQEAKRQTAANFDEAANRMANWTDEQRDEYRQFQQTQPLVFYLIGQKITDGEYTPSLTKEEIDAFQARADDLREEEYRQLSEYIQQYQTLYDEQWEQVIALQPSDLDELRSRAARDDTAMRLASYTLSDRLEILKIFFSAHDLLWAALALISAYQLAARSGRNDEF